MNGKDMRDSNQEILRKLKLLLVSGKPLLRLSLSNSGQQWTQQCGRNLMRDSLPLSRVFPPKHENHTEAFHR
jgi:hypothetical protein